MIRSQRQFIRQLGILDPNPDDTLYQSLMFQPRVVGVIVSAGVLLQSAPLFLLLAAALYWGAVRPDRNVFDTLYNGLVARRRGLPPVPVSLAPRRAAMGQAGTLALIIAVAIATESTLVAWLFEAFLAFAVAGVIFARHCAGACIYYAVQDLLSGSFSAPSPGSHPAAASDLRAACR